MKFWKGTVVGEYKIKHKENASPSRDIFRARAFSESDNLVFGVTPKEQDKRLHQV